MRMNRSTRIAIWALVIATAVSGVLAAMAQSEVLALVAAACATLAVVAGFSAAGDRTPVTVSATQVGYDPTTSATVDILDLPRPGTFKPTEPGPEPAATAPQQVPSIYRPANPSATTPVPSSTAFTPKLPVGSEPREVLDSFFAAARAAGVPIAAHLWLEDPATDTLRLVEALGEARPASVPVSMTTGVLGASLVSGIAQLCPLDAVDGTPSIERQWRYVVPLGGADIRGVAAVDFAGVAEPDRAMLTTISATLRASLAGALALHVARVEAETARLLVDTCAELSRVLDPDDVLHASLDKAMELAGAQTGSIMILDPATRRMRIAVARGLPEDIVASTDISEGDGIAGWVLASRQPLVIEDLNDAGIRSRRHGIRSAVCVPLTDDEGILGVLNVGCTSFHARMSRSHLHTLEALGRSVVVALRNAWACEGAQDLYFDTLKALALALEMRDPYSRGATARVVELADAIGGVFELSKSDAKALRVAAMLHDVGMSAAGNVAPVADAPLSTIEWGMLKMHPVIAAEIMSQAPALSSVMPLVYHHHEHYDGTGYVAGLAGEDIPLGARILAVADAYVAMTSRRPYRATLTHPQALRELQSLAGSQFDPQVVDALLSVTAEPARVGVVGS